MGSTASAVTKICPSFETNEKIFINNNYNKQNDENEYHLASQCNKNFSEWNYNVEDINCGPCNWPIADESKCKKYQSPIDFQLSKMCSLIIANDPLKFVNYSNLISGEFINTGHSSN